MWKKAVIKVGIKLLQVATAPFGMSCRYFPTCSEYAEQALLQHGALRGGWLTLKRLCRCHPWGGHGIDPVPCRKKS